MSFRTKAYENQEQEAHNWLPPYYKNRKFDIKVLGLTLRRSLPGFLPSFVEEVGRGRSERTVHTCSFNPEIETGETEAG